MTKASPARRARKRAPAKAAVIGKAAILATASTLETKTLAVPEWGGEVMIRQLDAGARLDFFAFARRSSGKNMREALAAKLVASMLVNPDGSRVFDDSDEDLALLRTSEPNGFTRVLSACSRMAKLDAKLEDVAKN